MGFCGNNNNFSLVSCVLLLKRAYNMYFHKIVYLWNYIIYETMDKARCIKNMSKFQLLTLFKQFISELVVYDVLCQNPVIDI